MKFKVGDKAVFNCNYSKDFVLGTKVKVIRVNEDKGDKTIINVKSKKGFNALCFDHRLDKVENKNEIIKSLEETITKQLEEINELKLTVTKLREPSNLVKEELVKSNNELRAEVIAKAKAFVEENLSGSEFGNGVVDNDKTPLTIRTGTMKIRFVVNTNKRTIVALGTLYHTGFSCDDYRGIAKCMPGEVFNEDIGKAIALGRVLELDVSEFENCVQPDEKVIGQIVVNNVYKKEYNGIEFIVSESTKGKKINYDNEFKLGGRRAAIDSTFVGNYTTKIVNDTNAIYEVK